MASDTYIPDGTLAVNQEITMQNKQIIDEILANLPPGYYGQVELHFSNGLILYSKTVTTKKFNTESNATGATNGYSRR